MRAVISRLVLAGVALTMLTSAECSSRDCSTLDRVYVDTSATLVPGAGQLVPLWSPAASGECHASFTVVSAYTGEDATNPDLPEPMLIASAHAVGVQGEQPGIVGIFGGWARSTDPVTGRFTWTASISAAAKNIENPAVEYGIMVSLATPETRAVEVELTIHYNLLDR